MNLKTSTTTAIELGHIDSNDNIELLGIEPLKQVNQALYFAVENKDVTLNNTFKATFGPDVLFFYALEQIKNNTVIKYERGLGYYFEQDNKSFLKRHIPIATGNNSQSSTVCAGSCTKFSCSDCEHLVVYSTVPLSYAECLVAKNSLISSVAPFHPHSFVVDENSLVGRLDGDVQSLSLDDKGFIDSLISSISKFTKQIVLKTSKLDVKKLSSNIFHLNKSSKNNAKAGDIIYDEADDNIKYYDGTSWRILVYQKDDE